MILNRDKTRKMHLNSLGMLWYMTLIERKIWFQNKLKGILKNEK